MNHIVPLLLSSLLFLCCCSALDSAQTNTTVSITNQSGYTVTNLMLFSQRFDPLPNEGVSEGKFFLFELDKHNPTIQFGIEGVNFAQYLPPPSGGEHYNYIIYDVDLEKKTFRIRSKKE
ncbi:hypothetical protein [Flagellimonas marinaquae]|uniref:hypothetical protein n=1 Tax=Flagellimonas marinaquae TaxID=254955 RepID=UPI002075C588|nr:hypothetical protein [Allomuricauda aquimarina]USD24811.1 hypothetical protein MJO53_14120 [Allomuricauda aquimarina]